MKFTLHRSLTFWAGLLAIACTCWAWWDSSRNLSFIEGKQLIAQSGNHSIIISWQVGMNFATGGSRTTVHPAADPFNPPFILLSRGKPSQLTNTNTVTQKEFYQYTINRYPRGSWILHLPYWLLFLTLAILWTLALLIRARRLKRAPSP